MSLPLNSSITGEHGNSAVLIVHGLFGWSGNWRSIARRLSDKYHVHCIDLRNHGQSPWAERMSYLEMAADIEKYIAYYGLNKPSLIGHSMGGKTVMTLLQNFDVALGQAIILDIAPVTYRHDHDHLLHAMQGLDLESLKSRSEANQVLSGNIPEHGIRQFLLQNLERGETGFRWRINLQAIASNRSEIFGYPGGDVVIAPINFIGGDRSEYLVSGYYPELKSHFPNARIQHIANAGHWLHAEQPEALLDLLYLYLE